MSLRPAKSTQHVLLPACGTRSTLGVEALSDASKTRLMDLPDHLLLQAVMPGGRAPLWFAWDRSLPEREECHLFQTCRQLRDLVLQHHRGLTVNIPAKPSKEADITSDEQYWQQLKVGCQALKRTLDTAIEQNFNVNLQTVTNDGSPEFPTNNSWGHMQSQLSANNIQLSKLQTLNLDGLQLPESFFLGLSRDMPYLHSLTLTKCQLEGSAKSACGTAMTAVASMSLESLSMIQCCFMRNKMKQDSFIVSPQYFVSLPNLRSFVYVTENVEREDQLVRCPWQWLLSAAKQITNLTVRYSFYVMHPSEAQQLLELDQLRHLKLDVPLDDNVMVVLLQLTSLQHVEFHNLYYGLNSDFSRRAWPIQRLLVGSYSIDKKWVQAMSHLPLDSIKHVEIASGYFIELPRDQVPAFLELAKRITWPAKLGDWSADEMESPNSVIPILPYLDELRIQELDLDGELAKALAVEAQHREIAITCRTGIPPSVSLVLPVLAENVRTIRIGPHKAGTAPFCPHGCCVTDAAGKQLRALGR